MEKYDLKKEDVKLHNIILVTTNDMPWESERYFLLEDLENLKIGDYVVVEGYHCSCYDFNDVEWDAIKYSKNELLAIAEDRLNKKDSFTYNDAEINFYKLIKEYFEFYR